MIKNRVFIFDKIIDTNGQVLNQPFKNQKFEVNVLEHSGNYLIHQNVLRQQIQQKQGTSSTKTRSEVRGGGRKPWRQKGTGRARAGSIRSPLWKGGGVSFGPKPTIINIKTNKKEKQLAIRTLLYNKRNLISVIKNLEDCIEIPNTKKFLNICNNCQIDVNKKILLIVETKSDPLKLSVRNIKNIELISAFHLNTLSLLKAQQIIITPSAINKIKEIFCD